MLFSNIAILLTTSFLLFTSVTSIRYSICHIDVQTCIIQNLLLTENDFEFEPIANNIDASSVHSIIFDSSCRLPVTYNNVCRMFPKLQHYHASDVAIKIVDPNTFQQCPDLIEIRIHDNLIRHLDKATFRNNSKLQVLDVGNNRLVSIDSTTLENLNHLKFLSFSNNYLEEFVVGTVNHLSNLQELHLHGNNLLEIDVEQLLTILKQLQIVLITGNNLKCERVEEILKVFEAHEVTVIDAFVLRTKERGLNHFKVASCIPDVHWNHLRLAKDFPVLKQELALTKDLVEELRTQLENTNKDLTQMTYFVKSIMEKIKYDGRDQRHQFLNYVSDPEQSLKVMKCKTVCQDPDLSK